MLDNRQNLVPYETVFAISNEMLAAAQQKDWQQMADLEFRCSLLIEQIKNQSLISDLNDELRERKVQLIRAILENDRAIRQITDPWLHELSVFINSLGNQRKLDSAYAQSSSF